MAHTEKCIGTWRNSTIGGKADGNIKINDHDGNEITGTHVDSGDPISGTCTGTVQDFKRTRGDGKKVHYKNGVITVSGDKVTITGKVGKPEGEEGSVARGKKAESDEEWTAGKTGA